MLIGAHVASAGGLLKALERGRERDAEVIQIFTQSPRMWRSPAHSPNALAAYREAQQVDSKVRATFCHATYLINLATPDRALLQRSRSCLIENLVAATAIGASGVILHPGSNKGEGSDVLVHVASGIVSALDEAAEISSGVCPLLIENAAGAGGTVGRTLEQLEGLLAAASGDERIGFCLDTQHLYGSGVPYRDEAEADALVSSFERHLGIDRLRCIHLNDSKVPLGSNRDRHENLGEGHIGGEALGWLISHPQLDRVPCILEVPGSGDGPRRSDVAAARKIYKEGCRRRRVSR